MTESLTEQWKDETLKSGFYWLKVDVGGGEYIDIVEYDEDDKDFVRYYDDCIKEVLAPVPSYEECKQLTDMDEELKSLACKNDTLAMENGKLQEQISEANEVIKTTNKLSGTVDLSPLPYQDRRKVDGINMETDEYIEKWGVK